MEKRKIAILEPNSFHGEVVLGVVNYFAKLDYCIDVFLREQIFSEFEDIDFELNINFIEYDIQDIRNILSDDKVKNYEFIFFTSLEYKYYDRLVKFTDYLKFIPATKYGILGFYHSVMLVRVFKDLELAQQGRIFWLSEFQTGQTNGKMLLPHKFPKQLVETRVDHKFDEKNIKIVAVGAMGNALLISKALSRLTKEERRRISIIHTGGIKATKLKSFLRFCKKVILYDIGGLFLGNLKEKRYLYFMEEKGRLTFKDMFCEVADADFLLIPFSSKTYEGIHYMTSSTSGTKSISMGTGVPVICNDELGELYGYNDRSSVFYNEDNVEEGFKKAIYIDKKKYEEMCDEMKQVSEIQYSKSINALTEVINSIRMDSSFGE